MKSLDCFAKKNHPPNQPCWGEVVPVDESPIDTGTRVGACRGHRPMFAGSESYLPRYPKR